MKFLIGTLLGVVAIFGIALFIANRCFQDDSVPLVDSLVPPGLPKRAMAIFPHPDDEIAIGGTLALMHRQGAATALLTLTCGGAVKTGKEYTSGDMLQLRPQEVRRSAELLGIEEFAQLDFPDGGLADLPPDRMGALKAAVQAAVDRFKPSIIVTYDQQVGLYGHADHTATANVVRDLIEKHRGQPDFPVKLVYAVTLPPSQIKLARKFSQTFRERYPTEPGQGLPSPQCAIRITPCGRAKSAAIRAHGTQRKSLGELYPLHDKMPSWLYWRILDREYFVIMDDLR